MSTKIEIKPFKKLSRNDIYRILRARSEIFVVEQNSVYLDPDGLDQDAMHIIAYQDDEFAGYCRIVPSDTSSPNISTLKAVTNKLISKKPTSSDTTLDDAPDIDQPIDVIPSRFQSRLLQESNSLVSVNESDPYINYEPNSQVNDKLVNNEDDKDNAPEATSNFSAKNRIGRVLVLPKYRGQGLAKQIMEAAIKYCKKKYKKQPIYISAQSYLIEFYQSLGFEPESEPYDINEIEHIDMVLGKIKKNKLILTSLNYLKLSTKQILTALAIVFLIMLLTIIILFRIAFGSP